MVGELREKITEIDRVLLTVLNERLKLVQQLWRYKEQHGVALHDPAREEWLLEYLSRANRGPLSQDGLAEFYGLVLDLTKREVAQPVA
jgi:3-deoxy-7-phosphoheptulonate synthase/chorismate mutase